MEEEAVSVQVQPCHPHAPGDGYLAAAHDVEVNAMVSLATHQAWASQQDVPALTTAGMLLRAAATCTLEAVGQKCMHFACAKGKA